MQLPSTLKDQGNYGDEIQTGVYILIALNELQAVLFCRIATQYPLVGSITMLIVYLCNCGCAAFCDICI